MLVSRLSVKDELKPYCQKVQSYGSKLPNLVLNDQFNKYELDSLLLSKPNTVLRYYLALSMVTLNELSITNKENHVSKYDNLMSGHEALVSKILINEFKLPFVRQLLIGSSHSDFYIPEYHLCIEPSSDRYFATSARAKSEEQSEYQRRDMNNLVTLRIENYRSTSRDLRLVVGSYKLNQSLSSQEIKSNLLTIAMQTIPRFIPYKHFAMILENEAEASFDNFLQ